MNDELAREKEKKKLSLSMTVNKRVKRQLGWIYEGCVQYPVFSNQQFQPAGGYLLCNLPHDVMQGVLAGGQTFLC